MIGALLVIGILVCQIRFGIIKTGEVRINILSIAWPYVCVLGWFLLRHLVRTPYELDQERQRQAEKMESDVAMLTTKVAANYDGRPLFVLVIMGTPGQRQEDGKYSIHWVLRLENHGVRTARYVRPRQVLSRMESFRLLFGEIAALPPHVRDAANTQVGCVVNTAKHPIRNATLNEFLLDNPTSDNPLNNAALVWWDLEVDYRDADESENTALVRMAYDIQNNVLYGAAVPYTARVTGQE